MSEATQVIDRSIAYIEEYGFDPRWFGRPQASSCFIGTFNTVLGISSGRSRSHPMIRALLDEFDKLAYEIGAERYSQARYPIGWWNYPRVWKLGSATEKLSERLDATDAVAVLRQLRERFEPTPTPVQTTETETRELVTA